MTSPSNLGAGLAVTSSTGVMSLAVGHVDLHPNPDAPTEPASVEVATERRHAEELGPQLQELLSGAGLTMSDLVWLAVDVGPGRFTGLRVGLATVRGLAFALGIPVVGLTSLEILAAGAMAAGSDASPSGAGGPVTAVIDARRQEVFQQVFLDGQPVGPPVVGRPDDVAAEARGTVLGDGLDRYPEAYGPTGHDGELTLLPGRNPRAVDLLRLAADRTPQPGVEIGPVYLRDPDATANIRTRPTADPASTDTTEVTA